MMVVVLALYLWALGMLEGLIVSIIRPARAMLASVQSRSVATELALGERIRGSGQSRAISTPRRKRIPSDEASSSSTVTTGARTRRPRTAASSSDVQSESKLADAQDTQKEPTLMLSSGFRRSSCAFSEACTPEDPCELHREWLGAGQEP